MRVRPSAMGALSASTPGAARLSHRSRGARRSGPSLCRNSGPPAMAAQGAPIDTSRFGPNERPELFGLTQDDGALAGLAVSTAATCSMGGLPSLVARVVPHAAAAHWAEPQRPGYTARGKPGGGIVPDRYGPPRNHDRRNLTGPTISDAILSRLFTCLILSDRTAPLSPEQDRQNG